jgi:predicted amidophosphoribosyltransferase
MNGFSELIAPLRCVACGLEADGDLCVGCAGELYVVAGGVCERCGTPGPPRPACPACLALDGFRAARSLLLYEGPARRLVLALKRRGRRGLATAAGTLVADAAAAGGLWADLVAWVPAGRAARRRGFDHAELLARAVGRRLGVPARPALYRASEGPRQADVPMSGRRANVEGRFGARPVAGYVLLVDDVFTTGATAEACALALLRAGARSVDVVTLARTERRLPIRSGGPTGVRPGRRGPR